MSEVQKLKRAVIKEELVALTNDYLKALILNQFIYWSERVRDFDEFVEEEMQIAERNSDDVDIEKRNGWIYKSCEHLSEELMVGKSIQSMRRYIGWLVEGGLIEERNSPKYGWDRTKQYRLNFVRLNQELEKKGYSLDTVLSEGYRGRINLCSGPKPPSSKMEDGSSKTEDRSSKTEDRTVNFGRAIPEIISETIPKREEGAETSPASLIEEFKKIRKGKYQGFGDIVATAKRREKELCSVIENHGKEIILEAFRIYMESGQDGLVKKKHPFAVFLSQFGDWVDEVDAKKRRGKGRWVDPETGDVFVDGVLRGNRKTGDRYNAEGRYMGYVDESTGQFIPVVGQQDGERSSDG